MDGHHPKRKFSIHQGKREILKHSQIEKHRGQRKKTKKQNHGGMFIIVVATTMGGMVSKNVLESFWESVKHPLLGLYEQCNGTKAQS